MQVGLDADAIGSTQRTVLGADHRQHIVVGRFQITVGDGKHLHGPGHVEQEKVGEQHHCHGFHGVDITEVIKRELPVG